MIRKPWPIVILAWMHFLAPIGNIWTGAWLSNLTFTETFLQIVHTYSLVELFRVFAFYPIAGWFIWSFRPWSYWGYLVTAVISFYINWQKYQQHPDLFSLPVLLGSYLIVTGMALYFLIPAVKEAYFNPRLRWWESKPRYKVNVPAVVRFDKREVPAHVSDVSEGGLFLGEMKELRLHQIITIEFKVMGMDLKFGGKVVHTGTATRPGCGIQFVNVHGEATRKLKNLTHALELLGSDDRSKRNPWYKDFNTWLFRLLETRQGLIPEYRRPALPPAEPALVKGSENVVDLDAKRKEVKQQKKKPVTRKKTSKTRKKAAAKKKTAAKKKSRAKKKPAAARKNKKAA